MKHIELEQELKMRIKKRRIIVAALSVVFLVVAVVFTVLYEQSKVVEEIGWGPIKHQSITYNYDLAWGILAGALCFIPPAIFWICDILFSRLLTFEINGDYVTFYRGIVHTNLYINGVQKAGISYGYYLEAPLSDRTMVNVALGKWSAHITFSNGYPPIDV